MFRSLQPLLGGPEPVCAPLVLNPLMARLAEQAGFSALYLGGGASGYMKATLEATLGLVELTQAGNEIAATTELPIILDGACGWGDPMHIHRTISTAEAAGFAAIEIEDQVLPKQANHHAGVDALISSKLMEAKLAEAVSARRDPRFLVIGRTNATDVGDAVERSLAYREAGADLLLVTLASIDPGRIELVADRVGGPLMYLTPYGGMGSVTPSLAEMAAMGYQLIVDGQTPFLVMFAALEATYRELARNAMAIANSPDQGWPAIHASLHEVIELDQLLAIERRTNDLG